MIPQIKDAIESLYAENKCLARKIEQLEENLNCLRKQLEVPLPPEVTETVANPSLAARQR